MKRVLRLPDEDAPPAAQQPESGRAAVAVSVSPEERNCMIAMAAYFRAERRGFVPGGELQDWLEAEVGIDPLLGQRQCE